MSRAEGGGGSARLLSLLRPYSLLFAATIAATVISSVLDGFTFVLLIPFLQKRRLVALRQRLETRRLALASERPS